MQPFSSGTSRSPSPPSQPYPLAPSKVDVRQTDRQTSACMPSVLASPSLVRLPSRTVLTPQQNHQNVKCPPIRGARQRLASDHLQALHESNHVLLWSAAYAAHPARTASVFRWFSHSPSSLSAIYIARSRFGGTEVRACSRHEGIQVLSIHSSVGIMLPRLRIEDDTLNPEPVPPLAIWGHTAWFSPPQR